jgi:hypothetical protein
MILYLKEHKDCIIKSLDMISTWKSSRIQKSVAVLYTNNEMAQKEIRKKSHVFSNIEKVKMKESEHT